ncbi:MAG: ABC transporter permease [Acidobacteria bacterium]|nr:ABC transporter permease [Acidobacteriota bacterium]
MLHRLRSFTNALFRRKQFEEVMNDEIRFHINCYVEELVRKGVPRDEAQRRARLEFGGMESVKEECRESRRLNIVDNLTRDLRSAWRTSLKNPSLTLTVVLTLALGIGTTTSIFSVVYGVLLKPLPFPDPDRLVQVSAFLSERNLTTTFSEANFWDMRDMNRTFEEFGALHGESFSLTDAGAPQRVSGASVSAGFFRSLSVTPVAGRVFGPGEDDPGSSADRVLLSHRLWISRFGGSPGIVGRNIMLDGRPHEVVGVLPPGTPWLDAAEVFVPFLRRTGGNRGSWEYTVIGRIKSGVTFEIARADLERVARDLKSRFPVNKGIGVIVRPSSTWIASDQLRQTLWVLLGAVVLLLAAAGVNVANLLLALASSRIRESAMRTALGARRADLVRESLTQSMALSVTGAVLGSLLTLGLLEVFRSMEPGRIPRLAEVEVNGYVAGFVILSTLLVGFATGIVPALMTPVGEVARAIRDSQRGFVGDRRHDRLRAAFVGAEVAFAVVLMIGAGLLVRSLIHVMSVDRGFQTERRLLMTVSIPGAYPEERRAQIVTDILSRLQDRQEVESVAAVSGRPLSRGSTGMGIVAAGPPVSETNVPWASWRVVTKDYFRTMELPLLQGRGFTELDQIAKPWRIIISRRLANLLWPGQNPIGQTAVMWKGQGDQRAEVIGVAGDMRERGLEQPPTLAVYFPAYGALGDTTLQLVMHTRGDPVPFAASVRAIVNGIDPMLPVSDIQTLEEIVTRSVAARRFTMTLLATFAGVALILALAGVYGIVAYSVVRRTSEIGVRLALGARPRTVLAMIVRHGLRPVGAGIVAGMCGILWLSTYLSSLLFEVQTWDPMTYFSAPIAIFIVAASACYLPARRVLRVDPSIALRAE